VEFDNSFDVPLRPAEAWPLLMDIRRIAPCMPGAEVTEVIDDTTYKGRIAVRLGPVALAFAGVIKLEALDGVNHTARVKAQGSDAKAVAPPMPPLRSASSRPAAAPRCWSTPISRSRAR
jgi:hypothetical protein